MKKKNLIKLFAVAAVAALAAVGCGEKQEGQFTAPTTQAEVSENRETADEESSAETASKEEHVVGTEKAAEEARGVFEEFTAQDLDGNEVTQEIFADYPLTMINIWATFCGPCLSEMPELGELSAEYGEKGLQIVGIVSDVLETADTVSADQIGEAKSIAEKTGASYLHIVPAGDLAYTLLPQVPAVPTTVFVDRNGKQIGDAVVGARDKESWIKLIDEKLAEVDS